MLSLKNPHIILQVFVQCSNVMKCCSIQIVASNDPNMQNMHSFSAANSCGAPKQLRFRFTKQWSVSTGEAYSKMHKYVILCHVLANMQMVFFEVETCDWFPVNMKISIQNTCSINYNAFMSCFWMEARLNIILTFPQVTLQWPHSPRSHLQVWGTLLRRRNVATSLRHIAIGMWWMER